MDKAAPFDVGTTPRRSTSSLDPESSWATRIGTASTVRRKQTVPRSSTRSTMIFGVASFAALYAAVCCALIVSNAAWAERCTVAILRMFR